MKSFGGGARAWVVLIKAEFAAVRTPQPEITVVWNLLKDHPLLGVITEDLQY